VRKVKNCIRMLADIRVTGERFQACKEFGLWNFAPKSLCSVTLLKKIDNPIPSLSLMRLGFEALESEWHGQGESDWRLLRMEFCDLRQKTECFCGTGSC
jgi:hypothetical protein